MHTAAVARLFSRFAADPKVIEPKEGYGVYHGLWKRKEGKGMHHRSGNGIHHRGLRHGGGV